MPPEKVIVCAGSRMIIVRGLADNVAWPVKFRLLVPKNVTVPSNPTWLASVAHTLANQVGLDGTVTFFGTNSLNFTGQATLSANPRTIIILDPAQTITFSGGINEATFGSLGLTLQGAGTLALTGVNTYSG